MVNVNVRVRDKFATTKRVFFIVVIIVLIIVILSGMFLLGFFSGKTEIILTNPITDIVIKNTNEEGSVDIAAVLAQGVLEFNEDYINYILVALGAGNLHKSLLYGNPVIEFRLGDEVWSSELNKGNFNTKKQDIENEDLRITISREETVRALLSTDVEQFMKDSVDNGNTEIEMISGKTELFAKGYLNMYGELTGEVVLIE